MKRFLPWILGAGIVGAGVFYWRKKVKAAAVSTATATQLAATKVIINSTAAMDEVNIPVGNRLSQAEKDTLAFQLMHQDKATLLQTANALRGKAYTKLAEGFVTKSDKM